MGSYFPESQRGTTESGWFLGHASPKVFSGASFIPNGTPRFPSKQRSVRTLGYCRRGGKALNIERPGPTQALLHSMLDVRCWAFLRTPERRAPAKTGINDPGCKAGASKEGPTVSRRALLLGLSFMLPSLRQRLRWIRECVGIERDWHNRSVAVVRVAVLRTLLDQTDVRKRRGPVACQI